MKKYKFNIIKKIKEVEIEVTVAEKPGVVNTFRYRPTSDPKDTNIDLREFLLNLEKMNADQLAGYGQLFIEVADYIRKIK